MRIEAPAEKEIAFGLEPCSPPVIFVTTTDTSTLHVTFADGVQGSVRFMPTHLTGVFEPLRSVSFFEQVRVEHGAVTWPDELDLAPDAMYDAVKSNGEWALR